MDQQLVRFMGMIQDMQNPEIFFERYEVRDNVSGQTTVKMGKYRDVPVCGVSVGLGEMRLKKLSIQMEIVESNIYTFFFFQPNEVFVEDSSNSVKKERQLFCCISVPALTSWVKQYFVTDKHRQSDSKPLHHQNKWTHPDESTSGDEMLCSSVNSPLTSAKRLCTNNQLASSQSRCNVELCLPVPDSVATTCLVKVRSFQSVRGIVCSELN